MTLDQIGQKLKSARDLSGLSLAQIQEKTKIPYNHLASIDAGNFDDLPEPVYVSGFIRRYAECVGLDGQELVAEYRNEIDTVVEQPKKVGLFFKNQKNNGNNMPPNYSGRIEKPFPNLFKLIPFYALWIVLILVLIIYLVNRQGEIEQNQQDSGLLTLKQSTVVSKVAPTNTPDTSATQAGNGSPTEQNDLPSKDSYRVTIKAKNHVWLEVKAVSNGEALFNGFIETGEKRDFFDKEGLRITTINGSVQANAAGKTIEFGAPGKSTEKIFINKVSQITENQTIDHTANDRTGNDRTGEDTNLNSSVASTSTSKPAANSTSNANSAATSTAANSAATHSTSVNKKPTNETTIAKKPKTAITPVPVTHVPKENLPIHQAVTPSVEPDSQAQSNKAIDVPYRYSE